MTVVAVAPRGAITLVTIDRPPANAMDIPLLEEVAGALEALGAAPPGAVVLVGRPGCFSAGADLKAVPNYGPEEQRAMVRGINRMAIAAYGLRCPVVAGVTGHAIAGGLVLALCADYRVAASEGRYGLTEVKVGVPYPQAAIAVVRGELAPGAARSLALTGRLTDAQECVRLGVFDEAVAPDSVLERALDVGAELAALPADTYVRTKLGLRGATLEGMPAAAESDPLLAL
ncbi:MAG: enoyl-CoA hydratase/isomerase family protein [Solirubrobacteraceae bacterium]